MSASARLFEFPSNLASGHLRDPIQERQPVPPWDLGEGDVLLLTNVRVVDVNRGLVAAERHVVTEVEGFLSSSHPTTWKRPDPATRSNGRSMVVTATSSPGSRTSTATCL